VKALSGYGVPRDGIAIHIGVDAKTLRKHFRDDLDRGSVEATAKVAQTLFHLATVEKNVVAVIFWMKARAGWREQHEIELSARPVRESTDAELMRIIGPGSDLFDAEAEGAISPEESRWSARAPGLMHAKNDHDTTIRAWKGDPLVSHSGAIESDGV
jgi:hypothetical protein